VLEKLPPIIERLRRISTVSASETEKEIDKAATKKA